MRVPLIIFSLLACACASREVRSGLPEADGDLAVDAASTCTQANMATDACAALRSVAIARAADTGSIDRALEWLDDGVVGGRGRLHHGYRADPSGFVAMAWAETVPMTGGDEPPEASSAGAPLASASDLEPGDALSRGHHMVLFGAWTDQTQKSAIVFEQPREGLTAMHLVPRATVDTFVPVRNPRR